MVQTSNMCYMDDDRNWQCDLGFKVQGDKLTPQHHRYVTILQLKKKKNLQWISHDTFFSFLFGDFLPIKKRLIGSMLHTH
jgi:hypothetical protein